MKCKRLQMILASVYIYAPLLWHLGFGQIWDPAALDPLICKGAKLLLWDTP